jgi:hypothetical protein
MHSLEAGSCMWLRTDISRLVPGETDDREDRDRSLRKGWLQPQTDPPLALTHGR